MSPPPTPSTPDAAEQRFQALYADVHADLLRFVARRLSAEEAVNTEDVVADALLVAWRRFNDAPRRLDAQRAWVFGIARNCLLTSHRGRTRAQGLTVRLADHRAPDSTSPHDALVATLDLAAAWQRLDPGEQEVLALKVFEDMTSAQAALVLGTTATGYRLRLMRARRVLRSHLGDPDPDITAPADTSKPATKAPHPHPRVADTLEVTR